MPTPRSVLSSNLISPLSPQVNHLSIQQYKDVYATMDDIIDNLDHHSIKELSGGNSSDVESIFDILLQETASVIASSNKVINTVGFGYLEKFSESVQETLRCRSLNYFILDCLPEFLLAAHNIEWGNLVQAFRLLNILAARDHGKTEIAGTEVVMFDGSLKNIEDIKVGDLVMGVDSTPREVLSTHTCEDEAYLIDQPGGGLSYTVNSEHILHYQKDTYTYDEKGNKKKSGYDTVEMAAKDFYKKSDFYKSKSFGYRIKGWDLEEKDFKIDPYLLGLWLGDGCRATGTITSGDVEVQEYLISIGSKKYDTKRTDCEVYKVPGFKRLLNEDNLIKNKHIPESYLKGSRNQRLSLLAGILDADGYYSKRDNHLQLRMKRKGLIKQTQRLCWSLGFRSIFREQETKLNYKDDQKYIHYGITISGDIFDIPLLVKRRIPSIKKNKVFDSQRSRLEISKVGRDRFYGFYLDGDHLYLHKDGTVCHNSFEFSHAYPLWQMYRYRRWSPNDPARSKELFYAGEGMIVTNEYRLGTEFLAKIKEEIEQNDILRERLFHSKRDGWGKEKIITKNGAKLYVRSANSKIRGLHPKWIVLDDFLNESSLYSQDQRDKYWNMFVAVLLPALSPGGQMIVVGTPFFELDMYGQLKRIWAEAKRKGAPVKDLFRTFEFPAIFPDGTLLFPQRHSYDSIMAKKEILGSLIFSREIMVKPITDDATIFPFSTLNKTKDYNRDIISSIDAAKKKYQLVIVGCDFAISASVGADYSVFTILGVDDKGNIDLLNCWRRRGKKFSEQMAILKKINRDFRPDLFVAEINGMQEIFLQEMQEAGLPVVGDFTGNEKKSLYMGVPSLALLFEQRRISFPYNSEASQKVTDTYFAELNSITFIQDKGKLESTTQHDDTSMSLWQGVKGVRRSINSFDFSMIG